jgi:hypothetical protein
MTPTLLGPAEAGRCARCGEVRDRMGLFNGRSPDFFAGVKALAEAADAAQRQ